MQRTHHRPLLRVGSIVVVAGGLVLTAAATASAHVTVTPSTTAAGAYSVLTFSVGHGCEGSPTTRIAIQLPEQLNAATPTRTANWSVEKVMQQLDEPVTDAHGNDLTERVGEIVYEADTPLPDGYRDTFEVQVQLPEEAGETLVFPVVQTCEKGETAWVEVPAEGQSEDDLEAPAPMLTVTDATGEDEHGGTTDDDHAEETADAAADGDADTDSAGETAGDDSDDGVPAWVGWTALGLGAVGAVAGGAALARTRKG